MSDTDSVNPIGADATALPPGAAEPMPDEADGGDAVPVDRRADVAEVLEEDAHARLETVIGQRDSLAAAYRALSERYNALAHALSEHLDRFAAERSLFALQVAEERAEERAGGGADGMARVAMSDELAELLDRTAGSFAPSVAADLGAGEEAARRDPVDPPLADADIFVFSIIDFDFRTQRPQHLARELSKAHRVFYVEMATSSSGLQIRRISESLYVVRLPSYRAGFGQPYTSELGSADRIGWRENLFELCDLVGATAYKHVVVQHPWWWQIVRALPPEFNLVVDCMDDISGFPNTRRFVLELEEAMMRDCDRLIVSSQLLMNTHAAHRETHLIRNGGETAHFDGQADHPIPAFLEATGFVEDAARVDVGYVGAIAEWFDTDLVEKIATGNPDMAFHLCGQVTCAEAGRLAELANVTLYGEIPYTDVPGFLQRMDVLCIPFRLLPIINACDPVKFYEYSAMGKPTVATRMPELFRARDHAYLAGDPAEFARMIRRAAAEGQNEAYRDRLRRYAARNTWTQRAEHFREVVAEVPLVSVVILSYGDPEWTEAALYSLYENGGSYPRMEVLVVDNGSPAEGLERLRTVTAAWPGCALIENGENLGFAKGNNVGIRAASGDFVLLLNNDTYVAPGAIAALVRHLQRHPEVGAVGPLTNNIGNEARLEVNYPTVEAMKSESRRWLVGYRGQHTELTTVAYFAVMMRRSDFEIYGLLSEDYGRGMFEDDDHCARIRRAGMRCVLAEDAFVHHHLSATFSTIEDTERQALFDANRAVFERKWGEWVPHRYRERRPAPRSR